MSRFLPLTLACLTALSLQASAADTKRIAFVSHQKSHGSGQHAYAAGCQLLGEWMKDAYPGKVETAHSINWPEDPQFFDGASTVVIFCSGGGSHLVNGHVPEFDTVMRKGVGLVCLHYAVEVPIGPSAKGMLDWMGGYFEAHYSVNPHWQPEFKSFVEHPITRGVKPFIVDDEWYFHMRFKGDMAHVTPILSAFAPPSTMTRGDGPHSGNKFVRESVAKGQPQHMAWAYQRGPDYGGGRGFGFTGLHFHKNFLEPNFRKTVLNAVAWTAGLDIPAAGIEIQTDEAKVNAVLGEAPKPQATPATGAKPVFKSTLVTPSTPGHAVDIDVDLSKAKDLFLVVTDGGNGFSCDWADWIEPRLVMADGTEKKLTQVEWKSASAGFGETRVNSNAGNRGLRVNGSAVSYGIGTHANSVIHYLLPAGTKRFKARGGLDEGGVGQSGGRDSSVEFRVYTENPGSVSGGAAGPVSRNPAEAVAALTVHPELEVQLFASEPMVLSPSAIDVDAKGRVWVCEVINYRGRNGQRKEGDRILILEDTNQDGKADKSTVFHQGADVNSAHGVCVLANRVLVSAGEEIFWLVDENGDDKSDRKEPLFTKLGGSQHDHGVHAVHYGPDGRLYFNFGNACRQLCDAKGELITDIHGVRCTVQNNLPLQQGMVFRCDIDGSNVEVLGWNFRNNWEAAVDSFGTVWQSDNDDDGNKGVRINYVMEFGNYGYNDSSTGAGWQSPRIGIESETPHRHWHLNDPGVVPNLIQTGAGSPTGIMVYEGSLLPKVFLGQPIHCDAGPNVVRAYVSQPDGAGYKAEILNILEGSKDKWFRPSDVVTAPDGSLIVADWYDPGVGGHGMGDIEHGRIFRVTTSTAKNYECNAPDVSIIDAAITALKSPNEAARFIARKALEAEGAKATPALMALFKDTQAMPQHRARALWLLPQALDAALADADVNIRITAIRLARQLHRNNPAGLRAVIGKIVEDKSSAVRREASLALRYDGSAEATELWRRLAMQLNPKDRWELEAIGIGAAAQVSSRITPNAEGSKVPEPTPEVAAALAWRVGGPLVIDLISTAFDPSSTISAPLRTAITARSTEMLRSLQLQQRQYPEPTAAAIFSIFLHAPDEVSLQALSLLPKGKVTENPKTLARFNSLLQPVIGKPAFIALVERLNLTGFEKELTEFILANPTAPESSVAARLIATNVGNAVSFVVSAKPAEAAKMVAALGRSSDRNSVNVLNQVFGKVTDLALRRTIVEALCIGGEGGRLALKWQREGKLPDELKTTAAVALSRNTDGGVRRDAADLLPLPATGLNFPAVAELVKLPGDAKKGPAAFAAAGCVACHQIKGQFINFGPELSAIGAKLSKEGLINAILYPSAAIEHSFNGLTLTTKSGQTHLGYVISETADELTLRINGGAQQSIKTSDIAKREEIKDSLMPPGLVAGIGVQGLMDLVAYLETLK